MYNSGDNRLGPAGYGIVGYEIVLEIVKAVAPADRNGDESTSRSSFANKLAQRLRGLGQRQPSTETADPTCIQSARVSPQN